MTTLRRPTCRRRTPRRPRTPTRRSASTSAYGFATRAVHAGARPDPVTGSRNVPIHQTTSYVFEDADHAAALFNLQTFGYIYSRITNPTVAALEERVAALEGGRAAVAAASGHAAQLAGVLHPARAGRSRRRRAPAVRRVADPAAPHVHPAGLAVRPSSMPPIPTPVARPSRTGPGPSSSSRWRTPVGVVVDLEALAGVAHEHRIPLIVDNTLATPYLCRPFEWGADLVVHSLTKFLSGHGTSMGGIVVESGRFDWRGSGKFPFLAGPDEAYHGLDFIETFGDFGFSMKARAVALRDLGPALSPTNAFHILTGIETLPLRMERHVANAAAVAALPRRRTRRSRGCRTRVCRRRRRTSARGATSRAAPGAVFTFGVRGGFEAGIRVVESRRPVVAPRQRRRHPEPHPPSGLDDPSPADRRGAAGRGCRPGRHPAVGRHRGRRRPHRRPRASPGRGRSMADVATGLVHFWFEFDLPVDADCPPGAREGVGVTAIDRSDAVDLVLRRVFAGRPLPRDPARGRQTSSSTACARGSSCRT